jgi:curved DNA-binding protein
MEYKDYYKILGVDRKASEEMIKRAYRKLAMQFHPDRNPGDKKSEEKFKEINEAYQVLSDPAKRSRYDQLGESYTHWQQHGAPGGFNWDEWSTGMPGDGNVRVEMGDLEDLFGGGFSEFFRRIFGGMPDLRSTGSVRTRTVEPPSRRERIPYEQEVTINLNEAFKGSTRTIDIDGRRLNVKTPPGAKTGTKIRIADAVPIGRSDEKTDLYLVIKVQEDAHFERKGDNLYTDVNVDFYTAILGGEVIVPTMSGNVVLTIPAGTQPGQTFRLSGRGMPRLKNPSIHGDLFVRTKVNIPRNLTPQQRKLFQELADLKQ